MSRARKYVKGERMTFEAVAAALCAGRYVFQHDRPQHPSWLGSMSFFLIRQMAHGGAFCEALINPDYVEREPKE